MKVLVVSLFHPELLRGGAQQVAYELFRGLRTEAGIEPVLLASVDDSLPSLFKSGARITGFDGRADEFLFLTRDYDHFWQKTSDPLMVAAFAEFLDLVQPEVVHFHHFMTYGIDFLSLARRVRPKARIVLTLHEFLLICAADGHMVRRTDHSLCTRASQVRCHQCFKEFPPEQFFLREMWFKKHLEAVDTFTVPSRFMIDHFVTWGIAPARLFHVPNGQPDYAAGRFLPPAAGRHNRFGFFGQFVDAKGLNVILSAVEILRSEGFTDFVVEINGDNLRYGSESWRAEVQAFLDREAERPMAQRNVIMNGAYQVERLAQRMTRVDWCIVPSTWWEIFGLVISEAWMFGRPVIASNIGGMKERIRNDVDGLLFEVGDARALAATMRRAASEEGLWERLVGGICPPPPLSDMVERFCQVYRGEKPRAVMLPGESLAA